MQIKTRAAQSYVLRERSPKRGVGGSCPEELGDQCFIASRVLARSRAVQAREPALRERPGPRDIWELQPLNPKP